MANRKDSKGRVLKTGESQRKDGTYMYRYTDIRGARQCVYAPDLHELRNKEKTIQKDLNDGIDYAAGNITVLELVKKYVSLKNNLRKSTIERYNGYIRTISTFDFAYKKIKDIRVSDAQKWVSDFYKSGKKSTTVRSVLSIIIPAFDLACNEDIIRKNPFLFSLSDFLPNDTTKRNPLTQNQQEGLLNFIKESVVWRKYYDIVNILLGTGIRVSELCGLTIDDVDFENRRIFINKQIVYGADSKLYVERTKTDSGIRYIPLTPSTYQSLKNLDEQNQKGNIINVVDGYHGFIVLKSNGKVFMHIDMDRMFQRLKKAYNKANPTNKINVLTPHVLRHTFCTNMANAGMDIKSLQYLMGHSTASMTLNVYAHTSYDHALSQMNNLINKQDVC